MTAPEAAMQQMAPMAPVQPIEPMPPMPPMPQTKSLPPLTPEEQAQRLYADGLSDRDKAEKLEDEAASATDAKKKGKLEAKARDRYIDAIKKFAETTKKNPYHYSAWGNLGHAYLKTGDDASALEACGKALDIEPSDTAAMEDRAEAFLALNRLDEVKAAYASLRDMDRSRADELAAAIAQWVQKKKVDPSGLDPARVEDFAQWAAKRK